MIRSAPSRPVLVYLLIASASLLVAACAPSISEREIAEIADQRIASALTAVPTPTFMIFPTPLPTATPFPTATPHPTATPVTFPPTPTPQPTATPQPRPQPVRSFNDVYETAWKSVFWIDTPSGRGTAWLLEPGLIVTAQHVVGSRTTVTVRQSGNPAFLASVVAVDVPRDIALLSYSTRTTELPYGTVPFTLGHVSWRDIAIPMMALGYSGDIGVQSDGSVGSVPANVGVLTGFINRRTRTSPILNLVIDTPIDSGDSGGPVLNLEGKVVGMLGAIIVGKIGTNYAVHVDEIRDALLELRSGNSRSR